jgi:hypothetical protein
MLEDLVPTTVAVDVAGIVGSIRTLVMVDPFASPTCRINGHHLGLLQSSRQLMWQAGTYSNFTGKNLADTGSVAEIMSFLC